MIEEQFGLSSAPFRLGTDARFYYESEAHRRAMAHLRYGLRLAEGFVVITGEAGVGKTMLVERLLLDLEGSDVIAAAIQPAGLTAENLPRRVLAAFGREAGEEDPTSALQDVLVMERARGAKASLIIDEAQHLSDEVLEALRLLLNLSDEGESLLQVCLLGQTGLRRVLFRPDMEQFRQRVIASHHLPALGVADTEAYIRHRMRRAGRAEGDELFTEGACVAVFEATGGVPRRINLLCGQALMQAALDGAAAVDADTVRAVHADSQGADELGSAPERAGRAEAPQGTPQPAAVVPAEPTPLPANDDEEAAAERALALVTARTEGVALPSEPEEPEDEHEAEEAVAADDGEDHAQAEDVAEHEAEEVAEDVASTEPAALRYAGQVNGGAAAGRYPVSVGEINAAIQSIQAPTGPANRPATRPANGTPNRRPNGAAGGPIGARDAGRPRRVRSPHELMLRKSQDAGEVGAGSVTGEAARADTPVLTLNDAPAEAQAPVDRAALDAFLGEIGPALAELRAALAALRERTDRLDEARRARRERLADEADEAAARLAKLRGE